jgi:hypothetical protein
MSPGLDRCTVPSAVDYHEQTRHPSPSARTAALAHSRSVGVSVSNDPCAPAIVAAGARAALAFTSSRKRRSSTGECCWRPRAGVVRSPEDPGPRLDALYRVRSPASDPRAERRPGQPRLHVDRSDRGRPCGIANPDNLAFSGKTDLWLTTDISVSSLNPNTAPLVPRERRPLLCSAGGTEREPRLPLRERADTRGVHRADVRRRPHPLPLGPASGRAAQRR